MRFAFQFALVQSAPTRRALASVCRPVGTAAPWCVAVLVLCGGASSLAFAEGHKLALQIEGLRSNDGRVNCALFAGKEGFPSKPDKAVQHARSSIEDKKAVCRFKDLPDGTYAVGFYHDEDGNVQLRKNFLGIPKEGWGVSRDAPPYRLGPPKFEAAAFDLAGDRRIKATVRY